MIGKGDVSQRLFWVRLPLVEGEPPATLLALAIGTNTESTRLVLCDLDNEITLRTIIGAVIPDEYQPSFEDRLQPFFKRHSELRSLIVAEGGSAHGPLTVARAIHFAQSLKVDPKVALEMAKTQSELSRSYCARLLAAARADLPD